MKRPIVVLFVMLGVMIAPIALESLAQMQVRPQVAEASEGTISTYNGLHPRPYRHRHYRRRRGFYGWIWWIVGAVVVLVVVGIIVAVVRGGGGGGGGGGGFFFFGGGGCGGCGG
ncbi:MAG: hypothetical protein KC503_37740 [Myxococcales bacterium]|nr:hypothetical protein [Myxococcales bacterium]